MAVDLLAKGDQSSPDCVENWIAGRLGVDRGLTKSLMVRDEAGFFRLSDSSLGRPS